MYAREIAYKKSNLDPHRVNVCKAIRMPDFPGSDSNYLIIYELDPKMREKSPVKALLMLGDDDGDFVFSDDIMKFFTSKNPAIEPRVDCMKGEWGRVDAQIANLRRSLRRISRHSYRVSGKMLACTTLANNDNIESLHIMLHFISHDRVDGGIGIKIMTDGRLGINYENNYTR